MTPDEVQNCLERAVPVSLGNKGETWSAAMQVARVPLVLSSPPRIVMLSVIAAETRCLEIPARVIE